MDMNDMLHNLLIIKTGYRYYILETKNYENENVDVVSHPLSGLQFWRDFQKCYKQSFLPLIA